MKVGFSKAPKGFWSTHWVLLNIHPLTLYSKFGLKGLHEIYVVHAPCEFHPK